MEGNLNLSEIDCRQYYQLVQENVSPEIDEISGKPTFTVGEVHEEVEDLDLKFSNSWKNQNGKVFPRRAKLKYFVGDAEMEKEDKEAAEELDNNTFDDANGDGHYIVDDDAWSDYWEGGVDDIDNAVPIYISSQIASKLSSEVRAEPNFNSKCKSKMIREILMYS